MARRRAVDFRYGTGEARVPWAAVGEVVRTEDIAALLQLLIPPPADGRRRYDAAFRRVVAEVERLGQVGGRASKLTLGSAVSRLEEAAKRLLKCKYALFLTNATAGFEIGYKFAGLGPGDEVIAPAITFISTILYPLLVGAKVVLADLDPRTLNMDPADVARKVTRRTKVIIPVHIGGYPADMAPIMKLARRHNITVIEDAAHAFGALYRGRMAGTVGDFGAFSFHEVKNINSLGEGGILVTNRAAFGKQFTLARFVGLDTSRPIPTWLYDVTALKGKGGYVAPGNHSATEVQAVALLSQMKRLRRIIARRRAAANYLTRRFRKVPGLVTPPMDTRTTKSTWHLYLLQIDPEEAGGNVQTFKKLLEKRGVVQIPHFAPLYKFSIMRQLGYDTKAIEASCPVTEDLFRKRFTHLPLYEFTKEQIRYLADAVIDAVNEMRRG